KQFQGLLATLAVMLGLFLWAIFFDPHYRFSIGLYVPLHTAMHVFSMVVACLVFAVGWNTHDPHRSASITLLACGFLGVALVDFGHTLSYKGMPDLVTAASPQKAINFSFVSRALAALALLALAFTSPRPIVTKQSRYGYLFATLILVILVYWVVLFRPDLLPATYVAGEGLTPFKVIVEYVLAGLHALAAGGFWTRLQQRYATQTAYLFAASLAMVLSQALLSVYFDPYDIHNALSHAFRVVGYVMIYRGIFISEIREPYEIAERLQTELRQTAMRLREMSARTQNDVEQERKRIAQSLHDEMGQNLTALRLDADWIQRHATDNAEILEALERIQRSIDESATAIRRIVADLRPRILDDLGIAAAASSLIQDVVTRTGLVIRFEKDGEFEDLPELAQTALYRMLQESLTNVARHAQASTVHVCLARDHSAVCLRVRDDGIGFDADAKARTGSFGLLGLTERAAQLGGSLTVRSAKTQGTTIELRLPAKLQADAPPL